MKYTPYLYHCVHSGPLPLSYQEGAVDQSLEYLDDGSDASGPRGTEQQIPQVGLLAGLVGAFKGMAGLHVSAEVVDGLKWISGY